MSITHEELAAVADEIIAAVQADDDCRGRGKFETMRILRQFAMRFVPTPPDYNENELDLFRRGRSGDATDAYLARVKGYSNGG